MTGKWIGIILAAGFVLAAVAADTDVQTLSGFRVPEYDEEGNMKSQLFGDLAQFLPNGIVRISNLKIEFYKGEDVDMRVTSPECDYGEKTKEAESESSVRIARGNMVVTGKGFTWKSNKERLVIRSDAKVVLKDVRKNIDVGEE